MTNSRNSPARGMVCKDMPTETIHPCTCGAHPRIGPSEHDYTQQWVHCTECVDYDHWMFAEGATNAEAISEWNGLIDTYVDDAESAALIAKAGPRAVAS